MPRNIKSMGPKVADGIFVNTSDLSGSLSGVSGDSLQDILKYIDQNLSAGVQNKLDATAAPTVNDDNTAGYAVNSIWLDTTNDEAYRCLDASTGAAVWLNSTLTADELASVALSGAASDVSNTPAGNIASTTVQDAINELDTEKAATSHTHTSGDITDFDTAVSNNAAVAANTAKNSYPSADAAKVGYISVTQAVDLDTIESDTATNNAKVSASGSIGTHSDVDTSTTAPAVGDKLEWDGTNWVPAASSGGGAWTLVSYSTATAVSSIDTTGLDLATDLHYRIIVENEYDTAAGSDDITVTINNITTTDTYFSIYTGRYIDLAGGTGTDRPGEYMGAYWKITSWGGTSNSATLDLHLIDNATGTKTITGEFNSTGLDDRSGWNYLATASGSVWQKSQTNVTSIKFTSPGSTKNWRVWVLKANIV